MSKNNNTKQCTKCKKSLALFNFRKDSSKRDGYYPSCNDCLRLRTGAKKIPNDWHLSTDGYIHKGNHRQHRYIMEQYLGRKLSRNEEVHHINHDKTDNRIENLEVLSSSEHRKKHSGKTPKGRLVACTNCGDLKYYPPSSRLSKLQYRCIQCYTSIRYTRILP